MRAAEGLGPRLARQGGRAMRNDPAMAGSLLIYFSYSLIVSLPGCESQQGPEGPPMGESAFRRPIFAALSPLRGMCSGAGSCASLMGKFIFTRPLSALCLHSGSDSPQSGASRRSPAQAGAVRRCPAQSGAVRRCDAFMGESIFGRALPSLFFHSGRPSPPAPSRPRRFRALWFYSTFDWRLRQL